MCSIEKYLKLETGWKKRVDNFGRGKGPLWTVMAKEEEESRIIVKVAALRPNGGPVVLLTTKVDSLCVTPRVFYSTGTHQSKCRYK
jgi:hypothetical protein